MKIGKKFIVICIAIVLTIFSWLSFPALEWKEPTKPYYWSESNGSSQQSSLHQMDALWNISKTDCRFYYTRIILNKGYFYNDGQVGCIRNKIQNDFICVKLNNSKWTNNTICYSDNESYIKFYYKL